MSSVYLRLLISPSNLDSSFSPAFHMMCSAYKLNKQGDNIQPWCTLFPILNQSVVACLVLTVASLPAYRFLRRQVRWSGIPISWRIFQFVVIHTVKSWHSNTLATSCEELTHWKRLWCWEGLGTGGEGDDRGWDVWMASPTEWTWVWVISRSWWWTGRPGVLQFMVSQRVGHDWATELKIFFVQFCVFLSPLPNIFCFCQAHTISVLYWAQLCMKCSLGISNFLEEISSLSLAIVFLYFFALNTEEGFLISPC